MMEVLWVSVTIRYRLVASVSDLGVVLESLYGS